MQTSLETLFVPAFTLAHTAHSTHNSNGEPTLSQCYRETCYAEGRVPPISSSPLSRLQHLMDCMSGRLWKTRFKSLFSPAQRVSGLARWPNWGRAAGFSSSKVTVALPTRVANGVGRAPTARPLC